MKIWVSRDGTERGGEMETGRRQHRASTLRLARATSEVLPFVVATTLCVLAITLRWEGTDLPAHVFRADLVRHHGLVIWNAMWYGGHPTLDYSVLSPVLGALVGPVAVCALSGVVSAVLFQRMVERQFGTSTLLATVWFAAGTAANLAVGRVAFALGLTFALAAAACLQARRDRLAIPFAAAAALASPIAAVGVAVGGAALFLTSPARRIGAAVVVAAAVLPVAVTTLAFPGSGHYPYPAWTAAIDVAVAIVVALAVRREARTLAVGVVLYAAVCVLAFVVPSPLGANISRFGQFFAWPLLACVLRGRARLLLVALAAPLLLWQWAPAFDAITEAKHDPSTEAAYYTPLLDAVRSEAVPGGRLEIPFTRRHWETAYVAPDVPLARGWERQLDLAYNPAFYDGKLDANAFHTWLVENSVQLVALPDTELDVSSHIEAQLLRSNLPYLEPVWSNEHWQLWRVTDFKGLVDGPATVQRMDEDGVVLHVTAPGSLFVRVRSSSHWAVTGGACVAPDPSGWIRVNDAKPGTIELTQNLLHGTPC